MQYRHLAVILFTAGIFTTAPPALADADSADQALQQQYLNCLKISNDVNRLRCYDHLLLPETNQATDSPTLEEETIAAIITASDPSRERRIAAIDNLVRHKKHGMLQADDANYFAYTTPVKDNIGDEHHAQFYLSIKYPLAERTFDRWQDKLNEKESPVGRLLNAMIPDRMNFHYNGLYDFYVLDGVRYDSSPVISRRQNPGISFEYDFAHGKDTLRLSWFHESNGQQMGPDESARFGVLRGKFGDDYALAQVSRGWDYAQVRWQSSSQLFIDYLQDQWLTYNVEARMFCSCQGFGFDKGREDQIWWEPGNSSDITDFDGLRGMVEGSLWKSRDDEIGIDARLEVKTGLYHSFGENVSGRISLGARIKNLRTTVFYFDGYGRDPSTYHLRTRYAGIGLELR